jgi:DNA-binding SARP family transcriptional activator
MMRGDGFRFTLLGPLTVRRGAEPLPLGPVKRRAMLATLVLAANEPVSIDRLTGTVWDSAPTSAVANLRTHAAALRQVLVDDDGTNRLRSPRRAYQLVVGEGELDLAEFDDLAGQGRDTRAEGDLATAVRHFGAALDLWQGEPAQDVPASGAMEAMFAPLKERRLLVFEDYADTRLSLAEHNAILGELQRQAVLHPHRERIWEQLAIARYRSGNVAGALKTMSEAFARLRADLGIEPGEPMRRLQRAILQRDPSLTRTPAVTLRPVGRTPQRPRQLPPDPRVLAGREHEARHLLKLLTPEPLTTPVVVVSGPAGAGSSALALHAAHRVADHFPGGELYADLRDAEPPVVLDRFLRALGADSELPATVEERAAAFRSSTHTGVLVVLDNAADAAHIRPLLPGVGSAVVATSRRRLMTLDGAALLEVGALPTEAGTAALAAMLGDDRVAAEPTAAAHLVQLCDGLPLALRIAAARLASRRNWPVSLLADQMADPRRRLDVLTFEDLSVRDALAATYDALAADDPAAAQIFRRLGTLPAGTIDAAAVADQLAAPRRVLADALERLVDVRLLESPAPDRYRITDLIHLYAAELAARPCARAATNSSGRETA